MLKKVVILLITTLLTLQLVSAVDFYTEDFGTGTDHVTTVPGWTKSDTDTSGRDDQFSQTGGSDSNYYAWIIQDGSDQFIQDSVSTALYQNIVLSYDYYLDGSFTASDFLIVEWRVAAGSWNTVQQVSGLPGWNSAAFALPSSADNTNIEIRFREQGIDSGDAVYIDNVAVSGDTSSLCGNGQINGDEQCDDGADGDDTNQCTDQCHDTICGDGIVQSPNGQGIQEQCDDGNIIDDDDCNNNCEGLVINVGVCGDGVIDAGEQCDDNNTNNGDGCSDQCMIEAAAQCGNSLVEPPDEQCDTANLAGQSCMTLGFTDGSLSCDNSCFLDTSGCFACGDNNVDAGEECDDGNTFNHDDCTATCQDAECGDGILRQGVEECDDGNTNNGDGCSDQCILEEVEECTIPLDVMLVMDRSGSMGSPDPQRLVDAKAAAVTFVNQLNFAQDTAGLTSFALTATLDQPLTSTESDVENAINALVASGTTYLGDGIRVGREELLANGVNKPVMIILSDGAPNVYPGGFCFVNPLSPTNCTIYALNESNVTKAAGIEIFTIGLGVNNFTQDLLKDIATDEDHYFDAPNSSELEALFLEIAETVCPCGNGILDNGEECDDGNNFNNDGCTNQCTENICGDGIVHLGIEECDEGPNDQCDAFCALTFCGDGQVQSPNGEGTGGPNNDGNEACDDGNMNIFDACLNNCVANICGDGILNVLSEECDDGNNNDNDGCDSQCMVETICGNGILEQGEECDDGNLDDEDGCSSQCVVEFCGDDIVQAGLNEVCELPGSGNNNLCGQSQLECLGNQAAVRDEFGDCNNICMCEPDPLVYECVEGLCGAECDEDIDCDDNDENTIDICSPDNCGCFNIETGIVPGDAKVAQAQPDTNFGLGRYMMVNPKDGGRDRSYVRLDVSGLVGQNISDADLDITVFYTGSEAPGTDLEVWYCPDHDFIEVTIDWQNQPLDGDCSLADVFTIPTMVQGGIPESHHVFDLFNETREELASGDGLFTVVILHSEEQDDVQDNKKFVQYLTKEYSEPEFRPMFDVSVI